MTTIIRSSLVLAVWLAGAALAAEPEAEDKLPTPRIIIEPPAPPLPNPMYYRHSVYDVWQLYAPDRAGYFKPRVIYSPHGPYWAYNGAPYPYATILQGSFMPTSVGTPYRPAPAFMPYCED